MLQRIIILTFILLISFSNIFMFSTVVHGDESNKNVDEWLDDNDEPSEEIDGTSSETDLNELGSSTEFSAWDFFKMIFATIFVVGLIYLLLKFINKKNKLFNQYKYIENIGGTSLGTNRSIQLVKVGDRILVVGVGEDIQLLKEIDDNEEIKEILEEHNSRLDHLAQPRDIFNKLLQYKKGKSSADTNEFQSILKEQLSELSKGRQKMLEEFSKKGSNKE
ncbi:flagellar biosynthetic protein FliO [Cytobacillus luteolus]|nr:flagellar biosynthetic protein FliO [Cytobacillus luteolus]MBP1941576.1 flagellar protein FliO/FliZ [Cytobacillus luteolus]